MEEATIVRWLVEEGDEVSKGDPVLEIDTDKTSFEVEANDDGTIRNLRGEEGETLPVGAVLAYITAPGEEAPEHKDEEPAGEGGEPQAEKAEEPSEAEAVQRPDTDGDSSQVRASPAARRAAAERELRIEDVPGSGPRGRVYLSDVLETDGRVEEEAPEEEVAAPEPALREPLSRIRRIAGERTAKSFSEAPHFYLTRDLEVDRSLELLERLREKMDPAPTITDLLGLAVARLLKDHPRLNGRYADDELELNPRVNLGIAVATDEGLLVPVLKGADALLLREMVPKARELVRRAREGELGPDDLSGGTFTLSNLGMMGIDSFNAIINPPEAAILSVGRVQTVPEWRGGEWMPHRVISATLSVDHRVADGADGARFLEDLQAALSDWELLL